MEAADPVTMNHSGEETDGSRKSYAIMLYYLKKRLKKNEND
jgi:hypothetical protein